MVKGGKPSRKRRRSDSTVRNSSSSPRWRQFLAVCLLGAKHSLTEAAGPFQHCLDEVKKADVDSNNELSLSEFTEVVKLLSGGQTSALGTALSAVVAAGQLEFQADANSASLQALCESIHQGIIDDATHSMDIRLDRCLFAMAIGDRDRDSHLTQTEYPRYANQVSGNQYGFQITFDQLPGTVQAVFGAFKDGEGQIDVTGAKASESIPEGREAILLSFCRQTAVAILAKKTILAPEPVTVPASVPAPVAVPSTSSVSFTVCTRMMLLSDVSRDEKLDQPEYLVFANRLSDGDQFLSLPASLQTAFSKLSGGSGAVDIAGSRPGQDVEKNRANLEKVCSETDIGLQNAVLSTSENSPAPPASAPVAAGFVASFTIETCKRMMAFSDLSRDDFLDQSEYFRFVNRLGGNEWQGSYATLPGVIQSSFQSLSSDGRLSVSGSKPGQENDADESYLQTVCTKTDEAIQAAKNGNIAPVLAPAPAPAPTTSSGFEPSFSFQKCTRSMTLSDLSRDNGLDQSEFFRFVNGLVETPWEGTFSSLPSAVRDTFASLASNNVLDVNGSKPGQNLAEFQAALDQICTKVDVAIQTGSTQAEPPNESSADPSTDFEPSFTFATCTRMMAFADGSRDNALDTAEFFNFVNRLVATPFDGSYNSLPTSLQTSFSDLATNGLIDVNGSKPGQSIEGREEALQTVCLQTDIGIQTSDSSDNSAAPVDTAIEYDKCLRDMIIADTSRDSKLDEKEYVRFIARSDDNIDIAEDLTNLSNSIQGNFQDLSGPDGLIDVYGSKPAERGSDSEENLRNICSATGAALANSETLGLVSGSTTVLNSFTIANGLRLRADQLDNEKSSIESAYSILVQTALSEYTDNPSFLPNQGSPSRRTLTVTNVRSQPKLYLFKDNDCPVSATDGNDYCQTVFGSFEVDFVDESSADMVATKLSEFVQGLIEPFLRDAHQSLSPTAVIQVIGPSFPVDPNNIRFPDFGIVPTDSWGSGPSVGQIVAGTVMLLLLAGGSIYCVRSRGLLGKWVRRAPKKAIQTDNNLNDNSDVDHTQTGANIYGGVESAPPMTKAEDPNEDDDNESVSFSVQDEETTQRDKAGDNIFNVFHLGKKKSSLAADDIRIMDDDFEGGVAEDFADYNFDEPSELIETQTFSFSDKKDNQGWIGDKWSKEEESESDASFLDGMISGTGADPSEESSSGPSHSLDVSGHLSANSGTSANVKQIEGLVDRGDWDGAAKTTSRTDKLDDSYTSNFSGSQSISRNSSQSSRSSKFSLSPSEAVSVNSDPKCQREEDASFSQDEFSDTSDDWRSRVEKLVRKAAPDELGNVDNMLKRFQGREDELVRTLENMYNRKTAQGRLKGVHKSKGIKERDSWGALRGNAEGNAVIAAASMLNSEKFDDEGDSSGSGSHSEGSGRRYGDDGESYTGSYTGSRTGSHSGSHSYTGSYTGSHSGSSYTGSYTGSFSGSYSQNSLHSKREDERGSYSDDKSYTGSYSDSLKSGSFSASDAERSYSIRSHGTGSHSGSQAHSYDDGSFTGSLRSDSYGNQSFSQSQGGEDFSGSYSDRRSDPREHEEGSKGSYSQSSRASQGSFSDGSYSQSFTGSFTGSHSGSYTAGSYSDNFN